MTREAQALKRALLASAACLAMMPGQAFAQSESSDSDEDIVVIGTLIRGAEVVGSQTISVDQTKIVEAGIGTTNQLLGQLPQLVANFEGRFEVDPRGFTTGNDSVNKPNLRNLPDDQSGSTTLVLLNDMRLTPVGVNESAPDVDIIPSNILVGIDAVTDGGSSLYGADAVGGVLNFRTRRRYEGIKIDANYGFGTTIKSYDIWDGAILAGQSWSTGNAYFSVSHYERGLVLKDDVPWESGLVYSVDNPDGVFADTQCIEPVGSVINYFNFGGGANTWTSNPAAPGAGRVAVGTACDTTVGPAAYTPKVNRTNFFASVLQDFSDSVTLRVTGYWAEQDLAFARYPSGASTSDDPAPNFPAPVGTIATVQGGTGFSFGANSAYVHRVQTLGWETWGITPELTVGLGSDWQARAAMHYGRSTNYNRFPGVNLATVASYIASGELDPFDVAGASAAVIEDINNYETANDSKQSLLVARAIVDGPLFSLPAGDVRVAFGAEYQRNTAKFRTTAGSIGAIDSLPYIDYSRHAESVFGEVNVPVLAGDGFTILELVASGRYDHYSDFGDTFNPNLGATVRPAPWLKIFGHWGTSFNAPTAIDGIGLGSGRGGCPYTVGGTPGTNERPNDPLGRDDLGGRCFLVLTGSKPGGLEPQEADSWAIGFEVTPLPRLRFGATFYSIDFTNVIGRLNPSNQNTYITNPDLYTYHGESGMSNSFGTFISYDELLSQLGNGDIIGAQFPEDEVALIVDTRVSNLNAAKVQGIDFHVNYTMDASFGQLQFGILGNVPTKADITNNGETTDEIGHLDPEWTVSTWVSWRNGGWTVKPTVNIRGPFDGTAMNYLGEFRRTDAWAITNLFIGYKFEDSSGWLDGTSLRLNVDNLFDTEPKRIRYANTNFPAYHNWTLGRVIKLGVTKEF